MTDYVLMIRFNGHKGWSYVGRNGKLTEDRNKAITRKTAKAAGKLMSPGNNYELMVSEK